MPPPLSTHVHWSFHTALHSVLKVLPSRSVHRHQAINPLLLCRTREKPHFYPTGMPPPLSTHVRWSFHTALHSVLKVLPSRNLHRHQAINPLLLCRTRENHGSFKLMQKKPFLSNWRATTPFHTCALVIPHRTAFRTKGTTVTKCASSPSDQSSSALQNQRPVTICIIASLGFLGDYNSVLYKQFLNIFICFFFSKFIQ